MKLELIIRSSPLGVDFALLRDGRLIELNNELKSNKIFVGDIFFAKTGKILKGLNACFIGVGDDKDGFLHCNDIGDEINSISKFLNGVINGDQKDFALDNFSFEKSIENGLTISDVLKTNQNILVQISKEAISTKGPRLTSELSIAGRYLILIPFSKKVFVSQKIEHQEEKDRLKKLAKKIKPNGFGLILRTVSKGRTDVELTKDLKNLLTRWENMCEALLKVKPPAKVFNELNRTSSILRDILDDSFTSIVVDDPKLLNQVMDYVEEIYPEKLKIVKGYRGRMPLFEEYRIEKQIKTSFGQVVSMSKGAYLVIEHTEALHVIDVNSGNRSNRANTEQETALEVNMIAATEVARQLRLRDMGGIIVVDFIDMNNPEDKKKLFEYLIDEMVTDKAKHNILPLTKFGLLQITRQRVRPETNIKTKEVNPSLSREVEAPITLIDKIDFHLRRIFLSKKKKGKMSLHVHPFVAAYLKRNLFSKQRKWLMQYRRWIFIIPRHSYTYLQYKLHYKIEKN